MNFRHIKTIYRSGDKLPGVIMISHARGSAGAADPLNELSSVGYKTWHAAKILNGDWIRTLRHTVSRLSAA